MARGSPGLLFGKNILEYSLRPAGSCALPENGSFFTTHRFFSGRVVRAKKVRLAF